MEDKQVSECVVKCRLSDEDVAAIKTVSGFLTRCRNALGNFMMVLIVVLILMSVGGFSKYKFSASEIA